MQEIEHAEVYMDHLRDHLISVLVVFISRIY